MGAGARSQRRGVGAVQRRQRLSDWARANGRDPRSVWTMLKEGRLPAGLNPEKIGNRWYVDKQPESQRTRCVAYLRVREAGQCTDFERQKLRVLNHAQQRGVVVDEVVTEVGSALNGRRPKLLRILEKSETTHLLVENRARLARFGTEFVEALLFGRGGSLLVVDENEPAEELEKDMADAIEGFCKRLFGPGSARHRAAAALQGLHEDVPEPVNDIKTPGVRTY